MTSEYVVADRAAVRENRLVLIERLADDLAHEIKNPLHSMVINLEVLRRRLARMEEGGEELLRYAAVLDAELERVNRRIDLLLALTRADYASDATTTLDEVVRELRELIEIECERRNVELRMPDFRHSIRAIVCRAPARQLVISLVMQTLDSAGGGGFLEIADSYAAGFTRIRFRSAPRPANGPPRRIAEPQTTFLAVARALADELGGRVEMLPVALESVDKSERPVVGYVLAVPAAARARRSARNNPG